MSNVGFRIFKKINRPSKDLIEQFKGFPASNICDEMNRVNCVSARIKPVNDVPLLGPAFTVKEQLGDIMMIHKAISMAQPGDIIVVDGQQGDIVNAMTGEIMTRWMISRGIGGIVIDGAIRDVETLRKLNFPVYAAGNTPKGPYKSGPGEINVPINCGGVVVYPGDIVVGDADGVVIIPAKDAFSVLEKTKMKFQREIEMRAAIEKGTWETEYTDEVLREKGCEIIDDVYK